MYKRTRSGRKRGREEKPNKPRKKRKKPVFIDLTLTSDDEDDDEVVIVEPKKKKEKETSRSKILKKDEKEGEECSICYEKIIERGGLDSCEHQFCFKCIRKWGSSSNSCPICRRRFNEIVSVRINDKSRKKRKRRITVSHKNFHADVAPRNVIVGNPLALIFLNDTFTRIMNTMEDDDVRERFRRRRAFIEERIGQTNRRRVTRTTSTRNEVIDLTND